MVKRADKGYNRFLRRVAAWILMLCITVTAFPINVAAATKYTANGKTFPNTAFTADGKNPYCECGVAVGVGHHWCCWRYASAAYQHIWGQYFNKYTTSNNLLVKVSEKNRALTAANLKKYMAMAVPGANLRIDASSTPTGPDSNGHSLIFMGLNASGNGGYFLEGNYDGHGRSRIKEWTWSGLVTQFGRKYTYIKYIMFPDASKAYGKKSKQFMSCIDYPASGKKYSGAVKVQGWAIYGAGISKVKGTVNGHTFTCNRYTRADVARVYPGYPTGKEGFKYSIPSAYLKKGNNTLSLYAYNGSTKYLVGKVTFKKS